jgi:hypothetical protein
LHAWDPAGANGDMDAAEQIDLGASDLGSFYEKDEEGDVHPPTITTPLPQVVPVHMEPMDFGNNGNSLLGMWAANSQNSHSQGGMDLAGESCDPHALRSPKQDNLVFLPFQWGDGDE